jgi:hypothetical protein
MTELLAFGTTYVWKSNTKVNESGLPGVEFGRLDSGVHLESRSRVKGSLAVAGVPEG